MIIFLRLLALSRSIAKSILIGRSGDSYRVGYCKVYQARMWKRALDESEIKANLCKILNAEEHSDFDKYMLELEENVKK